MEHQYQLREQLQQLQLQEIQLKLQRIRQLQPQDDPLVQMLLQLQLQVQEQHQRYQQFLNALRDGIRWQLSQWATKNLCSYVDHTQTWEGSFFAPLDYFQQRLQAGRPVKQTDKSLEFKATGSPLEDPVVNELGLATEITLYRLGSTTRVTGWFRLRSVSARFLLQQNRVYLSIVWFRYNYNNIAV